MHLNRNAPAWSGWGIDFGPPADAKIIAAPGTTREGKVAGVAVRATPSSDQAGGYVLQLKSGQGDPVSAQVTQMWEALAPKLQVISINTDDLRNGGSAEVASHDVPFPGLGGQHASLVEKYTGTP